MIKNRGVLPIILFNSIEFLAFFLIVYVAYLLLKHRWQNRLLILASGLFYASWSWKFLVVMLISISTDYWCSRQMDKYPEDRIRKKFLLLSISVNLLILGFFKYANFFITNFIDLLKTVHVVSASVQWSVNILLPLGISFYTFEAISYTVDVYRREIKSAEKFTDYLLFVIYFPHLIAGPIMRAKNLLPQIVTPRTIVLGSFFEGAFLFFWGLFEKMFVADNLAKIVNPVFAQQGPYEGGHVLLALYAFAFQIFCDFDGYSNMARGLGKCMGFDIMINFKWPYFSSNPKEFWRRWHISLSSWLRDYLYIPLGGNRHGVFKMYWALLATMLLGGLWHGAAWTFICWGLYQAIILMVYRLLDTSHKSERKKNILSVIFFFHLIVLGWLIFRAQSIHQIIQMAEALCFHFKLSQQDLALWLKLAGILTPVVLIQAWQVKTNDLMVLFRQHWFIKTVIYALMAYLLIGYGVLRPVEFIYFQF